MVLSQLQAIRTSRKLTRADIASMAGCTERTIAYLEKGKGTTLNTGKRIAKALKVPLATLTGEVSA